MPVQGEGGGHLGTAERNSKTPCVSAKTNISRVTHIVSVLVSQNRINENGEHSLHSHFPSPSSLTLPPTHHLAGFSSWFMRFLILEKTRTGTHCAPVEARVRAASAKTTCLLTTKEKWVVDFRRPRWSARSQPRNECRTLRGSNASL